MSSSIARLLAAVAVVTGVAACSESPVPLEDPAEAVIDARLIGDWQAVRDEGEDRLWVRVLPFDEHQMLALIVAEESIDGRTSIQVDAFRALATRFEGGTWVSASPLLRAADDFEDWLAEPVWSIARLAFPDDGAVLFTELSDALELDALDSPEALRELVRQHRHDPEFFSSDTVRFVRAELPLLTRGPESR